MLRCGEINQGFPGLEPRLYAWADYLQIRIDGIRECCSPLFICDEVYSLDMSSVQVMRGKSHAQL